MRAKDKQRIVFAIGLSLLFAGGIGALAFGKFKERRELLAQIEVLEQRERRAKDMIRGIPKLEQTRSDLASLIEEYATILPKEHHVQHDAFMEIIDGFRKDTNIFIRSAEPVVKRRRNSNKKKTDAKDNFIQHKYQFELVGTFKDFLKFVNRIENHDRFLRVDEFIVEPIKIDGSRGGGEKGVALEIERARNELKSIHVVVSTFTYSETRPEVAQVRK